MRRETTDILLRLDEQEAAYLNRLVQRSGCNRTKLLRSMIMGYQLCEKPDPEFYQILRELSAIGNRVNQLTAKANALNFIDVPMLEQQAKEWTQFRMQVSQTYLLPRQRKVLTDGHV